MTHFKILYHWGEEINKDTIMKKGHFYDTGEHLLIKELNGNYINLDKAYNTEEFTNSFYTAVRTEINGNDISIIVPRIYINIGTGIAITDYMRTKELIKILQKATE